MFLILISLETKLSSKLVDLLNTSHKPHCTFKFIQTNSSLIGFQDKNTVKTQLFQRIEALTKLERLPLLENGFVSQVVM